MADPYAMFTIPLVDTAPCRVSYLCGHDRVVEIGDPHWDRRVRALELGVQCPECVRRDEGDPHYFVRTVGQRIEVCAMPAKSGRPFGIRRDFEARGFEWRAISGEDAVEMAATVLIEEAEAWVCRIECGNPADALQCVMEQVRWLERKSYRLDDGEAAGRHQHAFTATS